jgi:uncharacterized OB-fold protein
VNVRQKCPQCGTEYVPELADDPDFNWKYRRWKGKVEPWTGRNRPMIQDVWPEASAIAREQLMTGLCSDDCWDKFLSE